MTLIATRLAHVTLGEPQTCLNLTLYPLLVPSAWPLKSVAASVLAHVVYDKVFAAGGWLSMVAGFAVALLLGSLRNRVRSRDGVHDTDD